MPRSRQPPRTMRSRSATPAFVTERRPRRSPTKGSAPAGEIAKPGSQAARARAVPFGEACLCHGEAAQAVADERIGACEVDRQPRFAGVERPLQTASEGFRKAALAAPAGGGAARAPPHWLQG